MSIRLMTAAWGVVLPDSEKIVLLALADCANDEGGCWPSMASLAKKCSKSDRTVQAAIKALVSGGHISRTENPGKGCFYTVHPRSDCTPEATSPPKGTTQTPEAASDKPSRTTISKKGESARTRSKLDRGARIPEDFEARITGQTAEMVKRWPPGRFDREVAQFRDHYAKTGGDRGLSLDWQASLRTWLRNADDRIPTHAPAQSSRPEPSLRGSRPDPALDLMRMGQARLAAERGDPGADRRAWPALPAQRGG